MPSKRESSSRVDYVPALCTHRPSLLPIERAGEALGLELCAGSLHVVSGISLNPPV
jgi:hypothetical protein